MSIASHVHKVCLAALLCAALLAFIASRKERSGHLEVHFLDIGQGDAIYMRTPGGHDILIDGGPSPVVLRRLSEVMPWYDKRIDVVLETHPDADHIGGLPSVLRRYGVGVFLEPGVDSNNAIDEEIVRVREKKNVASILARRGMRVNFGDGAHFDVLFPDSDPSHFPDTNTASVVGEMKYGSTTIMLTGDSPKSIENYLVSLDGVRLRSDILKAGHHGSHTSSGEEYVKTVSPKFAIISAGKDNRYGHPHKEVTDLFGNLGISVFNTAVLGTISFVSDGREIRLK